MRIVGRLLAGAGLLLVVAIAGIAIALATVDITTLVGPVKDRFRAVTGRELSVNGGARVAWSLEPRLLLDDVSVSNAPWGSTPQMLAVQRIEVAIALLPLLSRRVELVKVALVAPVLTLETGRDGRKNWDWGDAAQPQAGAGTSGPPAAIGVGSVEISDGTLTFRSGTGGHATQVRVGRLSLRAGDAAAPLVAEFHGAVDDVALDVAGTLGPARDLVQQRWPYPVNFTGEIGGHRGSIRGNLTAGGARYALDELALTLGRAELGGRVAVDTGAARPRLVFDLAGRAPAPGGAPATVATAPTASRPSPLLIPDTPIDFAPLRAFDAEGTLALEQLPLAGAQRAGNLRVALKLAAGRLVAQPLELAIFGGVVAGAITVDAREPRSPGLSVRLDGKGLDLAAILAALGKPRELRGGRTDVAVDLALRGASPHAWAASATGQVRIVIGAATLSNRALDLESAIDKLTLAVNPFRDRDPTTALVCGVVRLPLTDGVARIDRSIAMETQNVGVAASGTLDFRSETMDLRFQPKPRKGIPLDLPNLADLVHVRGPFASPQVRVDAAGTAKAIASIGAAVGTAGLSAIGKSLLERTDGTEGGLCRIALGGRPGH